MWLCLGRLTAHFTIAPEDAVSARCQFALITRGVVHEAYGARIGTLITVQEAGAMILGTFLLCARRVTRTPAHMGSPSSRRITISHPIQGCQPSSPVSKQARSLMASARVSVYRAAIVIFHPR